MFQRTILSAITCALCVVCLAGCASYDGSSFNYQSGGLPFAGLTFKVGRDKSDDATVQFADSKAKATGEPKRSLLDRIPSMPSFRRNSAVDVPDGLERDLTNDFESELNNF